MSITQDLLCVIVGSLDNLDIRLEVNKPKRHPAMLPETQDLALMAKAQIEFGEREAVGSAL